MGVSITSTRQRRRKTSMRRAGRIKHRQAMVDAARLLGFTFEECPRKRGDFRKYYLRCPSGRYALRSFSYLWQAAKYALEMRDLDVEALKPPRQT
jgi:hypothetical protein